MKYITIRDYAEQKRVTYEAVRQQVARYRDELKEHIVYQGKTQMLDEYAIGFLDERRASNPVVVLDEERKEEIDDLKKQVELLTKQLMANQQEMIELQKESRTLLEQKNEAQLLLTKNEQKVADYDRTYEAWANANMQRINAESEVAKLRQEKQNIEYNFNNLMEQSRKINEEQEAKIQQLENMTPKEFKKWKKAQKKQGV